MERKQALILLSFHSGRNPDIDNDKWINGFLGSIRKFDSKLIKKNFIQLMECLKVLAIDFKNNNDMYKLDNI